MRAVVVQPTDQEGSIVTLPDPSPASNDLVVRVTVAGINPIDWKSRDLYNRPRPFTLGQDFAGVVVKIGNGVHDFAVGERVFGIAREHGSYAEFTVVPINDSAQPIAKISSMMGNATAAALPTAGLTALACIERIQPDAQQRLLIVGVTGAVGQCVAQMAKARGITCIGIGRTPQENAAEKFGVSSYIAAEGLSKENLHAAIRQRCPGGVDAIIDLVSNEAEIRETAQLLRPNGIIVSTIRSINPDQIQLLGARGDNVNLFDSPASSRRGLDELTRMVEDGSLMLPVTAQHGLDQAVDALRRLKSGGIQGKIVLSVS